MKAYMGGGGSYTAGAGIDITGSVISATGGQSTPFRTIKRSLTSAQILNSFTTPVQLIAAPGAGKFIGVIDVYYQATYNGVVYATNTVGVVRVGTKNILNPAGIPLNFVASGISYTGIASFAIASLENQNVNFTTLIGNPTDGDGTIDIYLSYIVIDL